MLEEERKYAVDARFAVPDLSGCVPDGGEVVALAPVTLRATYYDTADRRLARAGVSLRYRRGGAAPRAGEAAAHRGGGGAGGSPPGGSAPPPAARAAGRSGHQPAIVSPATQGERR